MQFKNRHKYPLPKVPCYIAVKHHEFGTVAGVWQPNLTDNPDKNLLGSFIFTFGTFSFGLSTITLHCWDSNDSEFVEYSYISEHCLAERYS